MLINDSLKLKKISKYKLSKLSGVPQATINDICSGKTDLEKCSAGTLYRIAKVLDITVEDILDSSKDEYRPS
ncbi:MAG: helix-turn-helix transcriptional regulator [Clostridiales bacterium]|nr:helix-turn-helix transcriptional regulator [Clostridiales bacterium]